MLRRYRCYLLLCVKRHKKRHSSLSAWAGVGMPLNTGLISSFSTQRLVQLGRAQQGVFQPVADALGA